MKFSSDDINNNKELPKRSNIRMILKKQLTQFTNKGYDKCNNFYYGVGFKYQNISGMVTEVSPNGPADNAGLLIGDEIDWDQKFFNMNMKNYYLTPVSFMIIRNTKRIKITAIVDKICTEAKNE